MNQSLSLNIDNASTQRSNSSSQNQLQNIAQQQINQPLSQTNKLNQKSFQFPKKLNQVHNSTELTNLTQADLQNTKSPNKLVIQLIGLQKEINKYKLACKEFLNDKGLLDESISNSTLINPLQSQPQNNQNDLNMSQCQINTTENKQLNLSTLKINNQYFSENQLHSSNLKMSINPNIAENQNPPELANISNQFINKESKKIEKQEEDKEKQKMINHLELKVKNIMKENVDLQETILQLKENQEHEFSINKCLKEKLIYHDQLINDYQSLNKKYYESQEIINRISQSDEFSQIKQQIQTTNEMSKLKQTIEIMKQQNQHQQQRMNLLEHELKSYKNHLETLRSIELNHQSFIDNLTNLQQTVYQRNDEIHMLKNHLVQKDNTIYQLENERNFYISVIQQKDIELANNGIEIKPYYTQKQHVNADQYKDQHSMNVLYKSEFINDPNQDFNQGLGESIDYCNQCNYQQFDQSQPQNGNYQNYESRDGILPK